MNCHRMDGSLRDPFRSAADPSRVPAHPVQSDTDNVGGASLGAGIVCGRPRSGLRSGDRGTPPQSCPFPGACRAS